MLSNVLFGPSYPVGPNPDGPGQPGAGPLPGGPGQVLGSQMPSSSKPKIGSVAEDRSTLSRCRARCSGGRRVCHRICRRARCSADSGPPGRFLGHSPPLRAAGLEDREARRPVPICARSGRHSPPATPSHSAGSHRGPVSSPSGRRWTPAPRPRGADFTWVRWTLVSMTSNSAGSLSLFP
jgi:hypothetical protein